ncbi:alcohol dehydrogenase catalytic domain-containing protein [Natrarchaeobius oligotrophus]|uniref:Galactitol-1-phosphate 5-dehydrogenase n=1 Tax=Natrarchaeobius chitinivorans TaxID=1679083 RepID=A0A3N6PM74_NATCH|nr:alcohol dehydrogenase catalytic domain-containing protein [Natrarchaeobius chitinivorans]RQH02660.1 galactitol-1-phosphate 5-dehydrogenase [Natrarchaeobius chitinivorans]
MRVAELAATETVEIRERDRPEPGPSEVLVRVDACGVCTTDLHAYRGALDVEHPRVLGHESAGEIVAIGAEVDRLENGDRVAINPSVPCYECRRCRHGRENLCPDLTSIGGAAPTTVDGAFAEYVAAPSTNVEPIDDLPATVAAFAEPLGCCVHAVDRLGVAAGDAVAVIGAGPIGLLLVQTLRVHGVGPIVVSEPVDDRRELALDLGADVAIDPTRDEPSAAIAESVGRVNAAIEAVGRRRTIQQAHELTCRGGTTLVFGVPPHDATIELSPFDLFYDERRLEGTYSLTPESFSRAVALLCHHRIDVDRLVTDEYRLEELDRAFDRLADGDGLKAMVYPQR